jgi:hypothetical protein
MCAVDANRTRGSELVKMTLPKTSTFNVFDDDNEVKDLIQIAKNMGYKYTVKTENLAGCTTGLQVTKVTWIRRA